MVAKRYEFYVRVAREISFLAVPRAQYLQFPFSRHRRQDIL